MTDEEVINLISDKSCRFSKYRYNEHPEVHEYLNNRYADSFSLKETIFRLYRNIEEHPKCPICGKLLEFKNGFDKTCGDKKCINQNYKNKQ